MNNFNNNVILAQAEYRLKLLFEAYGVDPNTEFFKEVYRRIELTVGKATQQESGERDDV